MSKRDIIGLILEGHNGSRWDLRRGDPRLTDAGIEGLGRMDTEAFEQESSYVDGQTFTGWRGKPRTVLMPILLGVETNSALEWQLLSRRWDQSLHPGKYGRLTCIAADNQVRQLTLRFVKDRAGAYSADPSTDHFEILAPEFIADDPWWYGQTITTTFEPIADVDFYGDGKGPEFFLKASTTTNMRTVTNDGDDDAWPVWTQQGPYEGFRFVVDGHAIASATPLPEGYHYLIDTQPTVRAGWVVNNATGERVLADEHLYEWDFAKIPAGGDSQVEIIVTEGGPTSIALTPRFFKAF